MSLGPRIGAAGSMSKCRPILKAGCTNNIDGISPLGNTDVSSGARST